MEALLILSTLLAGATLSAKLHPPKKPAPAATAEKWDEEWEIESKTRIKRRCNKCH